MFNFQNSQRRVELFTSAFVIVACLFLSVVFPVQGDAQGVSKGLFFFFLIPLFYVKFILKKKAKDFGLNFENKKAGWVWGALMLISAVSVFYLFAKYSSFLNHYQAGDLMANNFWVFALNLLIFQNVILFNQEFFFRGFVLSTFREKYLWRAVFLQWALYNLVIIAGVNGFNEKLWQFLPFMILSFTSGVVAYKSRSIIFSWLSGFLFLILANAYVVYLIKNV